MECLANVALMMSAGGMIALAILTYRSVCIMQRSLYAMQKDTAQKSRPYAYVSAGSLTLDSDAERVHFGYKIVNVGNSAALIEGVTILVNDKEPLSEVDGDMTIAPIVIFPEKEGMPCVCYFERNEVLKEDRSFDFRLEMKYYGAGFEEIKYCYELICDLFAKDGEGGKLILSKAVQIRKQITT